MKIAPPRERTGGPRNVVGMKLRNLLPALMLCLTAACDTAADIDPVWGEWEARANGCPARTELVIDDDDRGDGRVVLDDCSVCQIDVEVKARGDERYQLQVDAVDCQGTLDLDCTLDDDELECQDPVGQRYELSRA